MFIWVNIFFVLLFAYFVCTFPIVVMHVLPQLRLKYEAWKVSRKPVKARKLANGEFVVREGKDYFHAVDEGAIPILISEDEGKRLWKEGKPI